VINKNKIIIIILAVSLLLGGFFYFIKNDTEKIVLEHNELAIKQDVSEQKEIILEKEQTQDIKKEAIAENKKEDIVIDKEVNKDNKKDSLNEKEEVIDFEVKKRLVSWGFQKESDREIDTIILHTSYNILGGDRYDIEKVIKEYQDYQVAPHYVIDRSGAIYQLVENENIAYHAGESKLPNGRAGVNKFSIGIEILNDETDKFTSNQYESANDLIKFLKSSYKIKYVLGHNQIAPGRKTDPWNINWDKIDK
jgi:hypothetical protein